MILRDNIRRALTTSCTADILGHFHCLPVVKRTGVSRIAFGRLQNLLMVLKAGDDCNCTTLAFATGQSTKSIYRDVKFLRGQGLRIEYNRSAFTYRLDRNQNHPWLMELKGGKS